MEFASHNDLDLIIKMEHHGRPIRVSDCVRFAVKVWTQNPNTFLLFTERDVIKDERADRLVIAGYQMATLESGVVIYEYSYSLNDRHFKPFEGHNHQDHAKRVVTDIYWKNSNLNQVPSNPVNFQSLNHLRSLIEQEVSDRENAIIDLRDYFNESFIDGLRDEIARSTAKEEELKALIDHNKEIADGCVDALLEKIEGEIKRSNEVDIELFNAIKKAGENTGNIKEETDQKIEDTNTALTDEVSRAKAAEKELSDNIVAEADRAKAAERELNTALTDEVSRAKVKEAELDSKIDSEIARAKVVEGALSDAVDSVRDKANQIASDLAAEVSRSNQLDNTHTAALNDETTRAKAAEKAIVDRLDVVEGDKDTIGSIAHAVEDAKHYVDDMIGKVTTDELKDLAEVNNALNAEISRATTAEKALDDRLDIVETGVSNAADAIVNLTSADNDLSNALNAEISRAQTKESEIDAQLAIVNGDKDTIGSIAHSLDDSKHYTDNQIETLKTQTATNLADALKPYATKDEVDARIEGIIGTAPSALDTLGEIADRLAEDSDALNAINSVLTGKADKSSVYTKAESDAAHTSLANDLATANTAISNEVTRAENAEQLITNSVNAVDAKVDAVKVTADKAAADLADEVNRAKAAETANANAISALDTKADAIKVTADKAAADIADLTTEVTGAKADINGLTNDLASEVSRATVKEGELESGVSANANKIVDLTTRTTAVEGEITTLSNDITNLKNAMDVVNGDETVIGSVAHAEADAKHYTDDEIAKVNAKIDASVTGFATKSEVAGVDAKVDALKTKVDAIETVDAYTKAEVDALIEGVDVSDKLTDYAKTAETTVIKDAEGNVIPEMVIDNGDDDDTIEVYTRAQCDELFAKKGEVSGGEVDLSGYATKAELQTVQNSIPQIVTLTQSQYDALTSYAPNTLYIVNG